MQPQPVASCLSADKRGMDRIMLEVVVSGLVVTPADIHQFVTCTLLSAANDPRYVAAEGASADEQAVKALAAAQWQQNVVKVCQASIQALGHQGFIAWIAPKPAPESEAAGCGGDSDKPADKPAGAGRAGADKGRFEATKLGAAAVAAGLQPEDALMMNEDVQTIARAVNLESDLHLMFLVAPVATNEYLNWQHVHKVLTEAARRRATVRTVAQLSGVDVLEAERRARAHAQGWWPEVRPVHRLLDLCKPGKMAGVRERMIRFTTVCFLSAGTCSDCVAAPLYLLKYAQLAAPPVFILNDSTWCRRASTCVASARTLTSCAPSTSCIRPSCWRPWSTRCPSSRSFGHSSHVKARQMSKRWRRTTRL